jgi:hypothetical protein
MVIFGPDRKRPRHSRSPATVAPIGAISAQHRENCLNLIRGSGDQALVAGLACVFRRAASSRAADTKPRSRFLVLRVGLDLPIACHATLSIVTAAHAGRYRARVQLCFTIAVNSHNRIDVLVGPFGCSLAEQFRIGVPPVQTRFVILIILGLNPTR